MLDDAPFWDLEIWPEGRLLQCRVIGMEGKSDQIPQRCRRFGRTHERHFYCWQHEHRRPKPPLARDESSA